MADFTLYGWEPSLSPHKLPLFHALQRSDRFTNITYIAQEDLQAERKLQGWSRGSTADLNVLIAPSVREIADIVASSPIDAIHIFSGTRWHPVLVNGLKEVLAQGRRFGIMQEPRASGGFRGLLRFLHSWASEHRIRTTADFVLAIGRNGPSWFRRTGYRSERIFPFAYFVEKSADEIDLHAPTDEVIVSYLGRLEAPKGVKEMLELRRTIGRPSRFIVAGRGPLASLVMASAEQPGPHLQYLGPIPMTETRRFLRSADIICAPSLTDDDGWCAVIGEALLEGTAVITTKMAGASVCIEQDRRLGRVLVRPDAASMGKAVDDIVGSGILDVDCRKWRREWAGRRLNDEAGAKALISVLDHIYNGLPRPKPFYSR